MAREGYRKLTRDELRKRGLSPTSERYVAPGQRGTISRRQYDNLRYVDSGWRNRADYERRYQDPTYAYMAAQAITNKGLSRRAVDAPGGEFAKLALKARAVGYGKGRAGRSAKGPMAKLLVYVGLRDPNATDQVGSTPPRKR